MKYIECLSNTLIDKTSDSDVRNLQKTDVFLQFSGECGLFSVLIRYVSSNSLAFGHKLRPIVPCGDCGFATKTKYVEILYFRHFARHTVFNAEGDQFRNKEIKNYINVRVVIDVECGNTTE